MQQWINEMTIYSKREITIKDYLQTERDNLKQIKKVLEDINLTDEDKKVEDMSKQFERLHAIYKKYIEALANYGIAKSQYEEFLAKEVNIKADTKAEIQSGSETKTKIKHSTPKTGDNASQEAALLITGLAGVAISKVRRKR